MTPITTPALVIGAGPAGLFTAFQLGLLEVPCQIVDAMPEAGGQCAALYDDKPIYDIPGLPVCTGAQLTQQLLAQIQPFAHPMHLGQTIDQLQAQADGRWLAQSSTGQQWLAQTVFIAAGVGAFQPRQLGLPLLAKTLKNIIQYQILNIDSSANLSQGITDQDIVIIGDTDEALQSAIDLCTTPHRPRSVTLLHRRDAFKAQASKVAQMRALVSQGRLQLVIGQIDEAATVKANLPESADLNHLAESAALPAQHGASRLIIRDALDQVHHLPCHVLWVRLGLVPSLKPLSQWPLQWLDKLITVQPHNFAALPVTPPNTIAASAATNQSQSTTGLYVIGDIAHYAGKRKLILSAFHEATLAVYAAVEDVLRQQKVRLEYTTSSKRIHRLLGVEPSTEGNDRLDEGIK